MTTATIKSVKGTYTGTVEACLAWQRAMPSSYADLRIGEHRIALGNETLDGFVVTWGPVEGINPAFPERLPQGHIGRIDAELVYVRWNDGSSSIMSLAALTDGRLTPN